MDPVANENKILTLEGYKNVHIANSVKRTEELTKLSKKFEEIIAQLKGTRETTH
jgi:hypothetical protein